MDSRQVIPPITISAIQAAASIDCAGYGGVGVQIAGTFSGTLTFEGSVDGVNFTSALATPYNSTTQVTTATAAGAWNIGAVGLLIVRARASAWSSGNALVTLRAVEAAPSGSSVGGSGGTSSTFGAAFPATGTAAGFIDASGNMAGGNLDGSGNLKVAGTFSSASVGATGSAVPASADFIGVKDSSGNLQGVAAQTADYDTGAGTAAQTMFGLALPASGGPVGAIGGSGVVTTGTQRVTLATDVALPTGSNVIGHVIADSGSTTAVTQATAANLNATVVGTGTLAVQTTSTNKTLVSAGGSASSSGNNTLVSAGSNKLKVYAFSLTSLSSAAITCIFQSGASGTELWRVVLQGPGSQTVGANLAVSPPAWLFATASATLLNLNLSSGNAVHWSVSYFDEA